MVENEVPRAQILSLGVFVHGEFESDVEKGHKTKSKLNKSKNRKYQKMGRRAMPERLRIRQDDARYTCVFGFVRVSSARALLLQSGLAECAERLQSYLR